MTGHRPDSTRGPESTERIDRNDERSRKRRESILDAAFHVFARAGYRDAAVDEIAERSETSKGGVYFHFPTKQRLFVELMRATADRLVERVEREAAGVRDPVVKADVALRTVLAVFAGHRTMAKLLVVDAVGAGRDFQAELEKLHIRFAGLIQGYLDEAVASGAIAPIDTAVTSQAWFGALNEIVTRWLIADRPERLEDAYPTLRTILLGGVGIDADRLGEAVR